VTLDDLPHVYYETLVVLFGLLWGSFLNVVIYRVPRGMSVVRPPSHCPGCGAPIKAYDNIPILGFVLLGGKARCCKAKMSVRYPIVEAIGGVLSLAILERIVFRFAPTTSLAYAAAVYLVDFALALALVAAAFIDFEFMIVPDAITFGGAIAGVATASFRNLAFWESLVGAAAGFAIVWLPFVVIYPKIRGGKVGMGLGDAKLLMLAGAWFGWQGALIVLGAGAVQGTVAVIVLLLFGKKLDDPEAVKREREELKKELETMSAEERAEVEAELADDPLMEEAEGGLGKARVAFGPFLILATLELLLLGRDAIAGWFEGLVSP
jgi:leader peptidase (prepilin peptidase) / N-methyltransferase